jgi:hypothetical protein
MRPTTLALGLTAALTLIAAGCSDRSTATGPKPYPLSTCPVTGEKLGSMGEPITVIKDGYEIKFCCQECVDKFNKHPSKVMDKVKSAHEPVPHTGG